MTADTTPGPLLHPASAVCPEFLFLLPKSAPRGNSPDHGHPRPSPQRHASAGATEPPEDRSPGDFKT
jgi:hypothetical protein